MKEQNSCQHPIDNLLKQTLKDDLPIEVENRLYIHLRRFQAQNGGAGGNLKWGLGSQFIKSAALAFAFVVFVNLTGDGWVCSPHRLAKRPG